MRPPRGRDGGRGRGGGGFRGGRDGGRGRFGGRSNYTRDEGPPDYVVEVSTFVNACEGEAVTKLTNEKIPFFNAPIYLSNKTVIGKVDEIFGPINESFFSIKMNEGIIATSYSAGDKFFIDPAKLLPLSRFLAPPKGMAGRGSSASRGRGFSRGASRGRGFSRGASRGRGFPRGGGGSRGGFRGRGGR